MIQLTTHKSYPRICQIFIANFLNSQQRTILSFNFLSKVIKFILKDYTILSVPHHFTTTNGSINALFWEIITKYHTLIFLCRVKITFCHIRNNPSFPHYSTLIKEILLANHVTNQGTANWTNHDETEAWNKNNSRYVM